jgi:hypothetical protein
MSRVLSIASSFFAACFIVLAFLGLFAWGGMAVLAEEPIVGAPCLGQNWCAACGMGSSCPSCDCADECCCYCDANCGCHNDVSTGDECEEFCG